MSSQMDAQPLVTVGIPVYNAADSLETVVRSAMANPTERLEILIVDNASTDETEEIGRALAAEDPRVRYERNEVNVGQNGNFTRVFQLARGRWLRWLGDGDTLSEKYVETCLASVDGRPDVSAVTTVIEYVFDDGSTKVERYDGRRPDGSDPIDRLDAMLALLTGSPFWVDPVYSLIRREALSRSKLMSPIRFSDEVVACELALWGPYLHVDEVLATRSWAMPPQGTRALRHAGVDRGRIADWFMAAVQRPLMIADVWRAIGLTEGITAGDSARAVGTLARYSGRLVRRRVRGKLQRMRGR